MCVLSICLSLVNSTAETDRTETNGAHSLNICQINLRHNNAADYFKSTNDKAGFFLIPLYLFTTFIFPSSSFHNLTSRAEQSSIGHGDLQGLCQPVQGQLGQRVCVGG